MNDTIRPRSYLLKPASSDCNLFCDYCFYRKTAESYPEQSVHRMSLETYETLVIKAQSYDDEAVGYIWQGGEPMIMGLDFFRAALEIQQKHRHPGQTVSNVIQTNAILIDDEWAQLFAEHSFLVGVSIDGPAEIHDMHRFNRAGVSVFDRVMESCAVLEAHRVEYNILSVVTADSLPYAADIYRFLTGKDFHYLQFIPCLEVVDGELAPFSIDPDGYGRFLCDLFDVWFEEGYPYVSVRLFDNILQHRVGREPESCMFKDVCGSYLVVEHNGDLYPCDFFVTPEWRLGNIHENEIAEIASGGLYRKFSTIRNMPRPECDSCRWLDFCHRGCVKFRYLPNMEYSDLNHLCDAYRRLLDYSEERYRFLAWDILRRHAGRPAPDKPGRNDPCVCGSGRKFKKCCEPWWTVLMR